MSERPTAVSEKKTPAVSRVDVRGDFPILDQQVNGRPLVYLDSAATTQKPQQVIDAISRYYSTINANVHRAAHWLSDQATEAFEASRQTVRAFINAQRAEEIVFTRGTTEGINLVAWCLTTRLSAGDEILISTMEHHSNIVPWQMLAQRSGATLKAIGVTSTGELDLSDLDLLINKRTKVVAIGHVSNALGTVNDIRRVIDCARSVGALSIIDGAQAALHFPLDVQQIDGDFYAFSGHKMLGPTGIGVLYGRYDLLDDLPPWQGGGEMIEHVTLNHTTYNSLPYRFEAGTPNIAGAIGLKAAIDYINALPRDVVIEHEEHLARYTISRLKQIPGVRLVGEPQRRISVISFLVEGAHPHDVGTLLDQQGIAVRTGHHCAMPLMQALEIPGTVRASLSLYNSTADMDRFISGVEKAVSFT
jgi:SufS family cysteine desulfurase